MTGMAPSGRPMMDGVHRQFRQVDVFAEEPFVGNPVAVVHGADGLADEEMRLFARWTNLSETTFLLPPTDERADYRVRIFTPRQELPFAGHPTLGTAPASSQACAVPRVGCPAGLITLRRTGAGLAFRAPSTLRSGPVDESTQQEVAAALGVARSEFVDAQWADNGPGWVAVELASAEAVLAVRPRATNLKICLFGRHPSGSPEAIEVRAFFPSAAGTTEDPVTGSLNAALAQWLLASGK